MELSFKEVCLQIVLLLAVSVPAVVALSGGAPEAACSTITPGHFGSGSNDPVPFTVDISSLDDGYTPGQNYTIILSGSRSNPNFRGFLIQGRVVADGITTAGTFVVNDYDQRTACSNSAATHTSSNQKTSVQLMWTAPPVGTGTILFRYSFVDYFSAFWPNQATSTVNEAIASPTTLITFSQSTYSVNENIGQAQPVLLLSMPLSTDITLQVTSVDVTATGSVDYHSGPYSIIFPAGVTTLPFVVSIYNDNILEGDEQFVLNINNALLPYNVITNSSSRATVIIKDDDMMQAEEPVIAGGQCIPQPKVIPSTEMAVMIGSPAYIIHGYDLTITCTVVGGSSPITISWYRDGELDRSKGNMSTVKIASVKFHEDNGVVYTCRADNNGGYVEEFTKVNVFAQLCSHDVCNLRENTLCTIPNSTCLCEPQLGYCSAVYYSTETRPIPSTCERCRNPIDLKCLKRWSDCVKKNDDDIHGRFTQHTKTAANFKIYIHPC